MTKPKRRRPRAAPSKTMTIREIAREAGVSTATVSRVLNRPKEVSPATRAKVLAVSERNHYVSDGLAVGLVSRRSNLLGLVIPTITNSIYASSTQAIQRAAQKAGYTVLVGISDFSPEIEAGLVHKLIERRVEGLILTGAARPARLYAKLDRNGVPFVITWKLDDAPGLACVSFDNYKAAMAAVDYLVSLGHRRIGLVCGRGEVNDRAHDRRRAFVDGLAKHGLTLDPALIHEGDFEFIEGRAALHRMLRQSRPPTAVFCANDIQALGALYECQDAGLRVPRDISIVGFDDLPISQYASPRLTTIRVPAAEMGLRATRVLLERIGGETALPKIELATDLVIRDSTGPRPVSRRARKTAASTDAR